MAKVKAKLTKIHNGLGQAFSAAQPSLGVRFRQSIDEMGLVDTGNFRESQRQKKVNLRKWQYTWGNRRVPYAIALYSGYTTRSGRRVEGRNWIAHAITRTDLAKIVRANSPFMAP